MQIEKDHARITAGVMAGRTTGAPISLLVENRDFKNWKDIYNSLDCAIKLIRKSYLDLGSRKKEYLAIYQDIVKRNLSLTGQLRYWKSLKTVKQAQQKATKIDRQSSNTVIANNAMRRWQNAMAVDGFSK